ncbi:MAG: cation:proton antiporter [Elainellaceae cyanobacterium]
MMIGAAVTSTDPIVATSIVTGIVAEDNLPTRVRHIISAESGSNDGLAYPLVLLCILFLEQAGTASEIGSGAGIWLYWFTHVIVAEVGGAIVFGLLAGYAAGQLLKWSERQKLIENTSFIAYSLALSITLLGAAKLWGTDGILAVFMAGLAFSQVIGGSQRAQEENVQEAINRFFTLPIFILLGLLLPWEQWFAFGWKSLLLAIARFHRCKTCQKLCLSGGLAPLV